MTASDPKTTWLNVHRQLSAEADASRNSQAVAFGLLAMYDALSPEEQQCIHSVLAEWIVSEDNKLRYDAAFLTSERRILPMAASIRKAVLRLRGRAGPEAEYEVKKLLRILDELT